MLHSKLEEATGDIEALRKQLQKKNSCVEQNMGYQESDIFVCTNIEYEQLVQELEKFQQKVNISTNIHYYITRN